MEKLVCSTNVFENYCANVLVAYFPLVNLQPQPRKISVRDHGTTKPDFDMVLYRQPRHTFLEVTISPLRPEWDRKAQQKDILMAYATQHPEKSALVLYIQNMYSPELIRMSLPVLEHLAMGRLASADAQKQVDSIALKSGVSHIAAERQVDWELVYESFMRG